MDGVTVVGFFRVPNFPSGSREDVLVPVVPVPVHHFACSPPPASGPASRSVPWRITWCPVRSRGAMEDQWCSAQGLDPREPAREGITTGPHARQGITRATLDPRTAVPPCTHACAGRHNGLQVPLGTSENITGWKRHRHHRTPLSVLGRRNEGVLPPPPPGSILKMNCRHNSVPASPRNHRSSGESTQSRTRKVCLGATPPRKKLFSRRERAK